MKFLTKDWVEALEATLQANENFKSATANTELKLEFHVPDAPEGTEGAYVVTMDKGTVSVTPGQAEDSDVTITSNYETAVAIFKGEINTQMAFMTGKIKVSGNMTKLITNQAMLSQFANATAGMEVEY